MTIARLLKITAAICFAAAAIGLSFPVGLVALGLLLFTVAELV